MATIFIASSQTSDQQDISPILDRVSDENSLRGFIGSIIERVNLVADRGISVLANYPIIALVSIVALAAIVAIVFFRLFKSSKSTPKKVVKTVVYTSMIVFFFATVLFLFKTNTVIEIVRNQASMDQIRGLLQGIDFTYAGSTVNLQTHGVEGLMNFFLRKSAHFFLFALLGFFVFLAMFKLSNKSLASFIVAIVIVIAYAALDEYRQTFIPSRSGLIEDVILDTAGGIFGVSMGWLKKLVSKWLG